MVKKLFKKKGNCLVESESERALHSPFDIDRFAILG